MKHRTKNILRAMAKHFGLKVKFVNHLGENIHGKFFPRENRILINAHKPRYEHTFTLLHEIAHHLLHVQNPRRKRHPRIFDTRWKINRVATLCSKVRRTFRYIYNKESGKEWEANLWAMCAFICLAKRCGCKDQLLAFLDKNPEKHRIFLLAITGSIYCDLKKRIMTGLNTLFKPLHLFS